MLETLNELFNENCNGLHSNNLHFHTPPDINVKTLNAVFTIPCTSLNFEQRTFEHHFKLMANFHSSLVVRVILYLFNNVYIYKALFTNIHIKIDVESYIITGFIILP